MTGYLNEWALFLKQSHSVTGFPLVVGGLGLMLFGWRMWKVCVMCAYGLLGALVTATVVGTSEQQLEYALVGGCALGLLSYWPVKCAVSLLGGMIGAGIVAQSLVNLGLRGTPLWAASGTALIVFTAFSFLHRQNVVIVVTSFIGAGLLLSGVAAWIMTSHALSGSARSLVSGSALVLLFLVAVPAVMSCFYQSAEVRRLNVEL